MKIKIVLGEIRKIIDAESIWYDLRDKYEATPLFEVIKNEKDTSSTRYRESEKKIRDYTSDILAEGDLGYEINATMKKTLATYESEESMVQMLYGHLLEVGFEVPLRYHDVLPFKIIKHEGVAYHYTLSQMDKEKDERYYIFVTRDELKKMEVQESEEGIVNRVIDYIKYEM